MSDVLSVIFERWDRHPSDHEYGEAIDRRIDRLAGGSDQVMRLDPNPQVPIKGFAARLELHETGPIFLLDPSNLPTLMPLLDDVRGMALDWAKRSTGGQQKMLTVNIRYGPEVSITEQSYSWERVKVTTDPLTFDNHLGELIEFVLHMGSS